MIPTVSTFTARIEIPPVHRRAVLLFLNMSQNERAIVEANRLDENVYDTEPRHSPGDIARIEDELDAIFRERFIDTLPLTREEEDEGIGWDRIQRESTRHYLEEYKMELRKLTWQRTLYNYLESPYIREFDAEREAVLHADKLKPIVTKIRNDIRRYANKGFTRV